ncbi:allantoate deiminase [Halobacillus sp. Marseille-P3879]|uniref:allantoate deiminase n=1 Tax=Halobacillus sp. Marseille-P3879 TaxID=2045014 RepID=UPI001F1878CC|nr:allantoate deiminase [Halobacillus sp. Marseille-P3879]
MAFETKHVMKTADSPESLVDWLSSFGLSDKGGVNRLLYSKPWVEAQKALKSQWEEHGLVTSFDSVGNLFGRLEGKESSSCILTGSHIDSVSNGGKFDGVYGIIASFSAVQRLKEAYGSPKKSIEIVSLCEEEGSRFPITFWGSGNITGKYDISDAEGIKDTQGISLKEAMKSAGFDPQFYQSPARKDIDCFIECHIEQGIVLERARKSLGIVSDIVGQKRFTITILGESNHAGTTPMSYRKDSMSSAADIIHSITGKAKETDSGLVATIGRLTTSPNVPNVIAGETSFTLDVRHHNQETLDHFCKEIEDYCSKIARKQDLHISMDKWTDVKPVQMHPQLTRLCEQAAQQQEIPYQFMISGAGHDAQMLGTTYPTSLLFVPSCNGISHSPKEFTSAEDLENGIAALTAILYELAYT